MTKTPLDHIGTLAEAHHDAHKELTEIVTELEAHLESVRKQFIKDLNRAVIKARTTRANLEAAIEAAPPHVFLKPRTLLIHGVQVGLEKGKDSLSVADEANAIAIIERDMPALAGTAIKTEKKLVAAMIKGFNTEALNHIGAKIIPGVDAVVIKEATSPVEKTVKALLSAKAKAE